MIAAFVIWSVITLCLLGIGVWSWFSTKPAGFFAGVEPPKVRDAKAYNHAVGILWFVYAVLFEALGVPLLFLQQNAAGFLWVVLAIPILSIGLMLGYHLILNKYKA